MRNYLIKNTKELLCSNCGAVHKFYTYQCVAAEFDWMVEPHDREHIMRVFTPYIRSTRRTGYPGRFFEPRFGLGLDAYTYPRPYSW